MSLQLTERRGFAFYSRALGIQRRVLVALMVRSLMMKYGRNNIGFLWIVLEPMILCSGVLVVRSLIQGGSEYGVSLIAMLVSGYLPLTLWRHLSNPGCFMLRRSGSMLYHRDITLIDCMLAVLILEVGGCTIAGVVVYWALYTLGLIEPIYDVGLVLSGWLLMGFLAFSVMVVFAVLTEYYEAAERFIQPFQYLFLPICGFFYMVAWLPTSAQKLAWYVPTVHCFEMVRAGLLGPSIETHYTPWYPLLYGLLQLAWALPMIEKARNKIHFG